MHDDHPTQRRNSGSRKRVTRERREKRNARGPRKTMTVNPSRTARLILILLILAAAMTAVTITLSTFSKPGSATNAGEKPLLTEFGDFQCPYCANFALIILPALERDLIGPGTVQFEYRHYPFLGPESFERRRGVRVRPGPGKVQGVPRRAV